MTRLLLATDAVGGVWAYSLELARALEPLGVKTLLAVMGPPPSAEQREDAAGIDLVDTGLPLEWLDTDPAGLRRAGEAIAELGSTVGADIVQTCTGALLAETQFTQPTIAVQHSCVATWWAAVNGTPLPAEFEWRRALVDHGLNRARAVVAPSAAFAADTALAYPLSQPIETVHNGRRPIAPAAVPQGEFVFTAGRLWDEGKNVATLDAAAARIEAPFQAAGPLRGPNGAAIELAHLRHVGELSATRIAGLMAARPVFASAAVYEPFGLTALEAAVAGCALVLSDIPTHRELWSDAAVFVPPRDDVSFAEMIRALLADGAAREALGEAARERAQQYTPERMAAQMSEIYARLAQPVAEPRPVAGAV
jgi:glycosyltransferase involved in cell wall biosynthesis